VSKGWKWGQLDGGTLEPEDNSGAREILAMAVGVATLFSFLQANLTGYVLPLFSVCVLFSLSPLCADLGLIQKRCDNRNGQNPVAYVLMYNILLL
jgi:hypothetical protein